jgi:ethanolamine transporter EutH
MAPFAGFTLAQTLWCLLDLAGFLVALHQAEDPTFAKKFAYLVVGLTCGSWIVYEVLRLHFFPTSHDGSIPLLPEVMVVWIALCSLLRTILHPEGIFSRASVAVYALVLALAVVGMFLNVLL